MRSRIVKPTTVVAWHRRGFARFWTEKSRPWGRPPIGDELIELVGRMARENPMCSRRRIASELAMLGFNVDKNTVAKYMPKPLGPPRRPSPTWSTFVRARLAGTIAIDFLTVPTVTFDIGFDAGVVRMIRDRDSIYGVVYSTRVERMGIRQLRTVPRSPWQNGFAERFVGTLRRELLDHEIVLGEGICCDWSVSTPPTTTKPGRTCRSTEMRPSRARSNHPARAASSPFPR